MKQPNILMVMGDQHAAPLLGSYGHRVVKTPHLDALAENGVVFEHAYCNNPLCVPSRASMVTGRYCCRIGSFDNGCELPASIPTFLHYLRRAGYRTILSGKMHYIGPDQLHGFEERLTTDIYPSFMVWTPDWRRGLYLNTGTSVDQLKETGLCKWNLQLDYDEETHFRALERMAQLARDKNDRKPFLLCVSYTHPHDPYIITQQYWDMYDHDSIDLPAAPAKPMEELHPFNRWLQIHHGVDIYPPDEETVRRTRHAYYGQISYLDEKLGDLIRALHHLGLAEDTIIIYASDHGDMMGEHGMWFKRTFFEWSSRVPLIFAYPSMWPKGRRVKEVVSLVDLFPTLLDTCGIEPPETLIDGDSFKPLLEGKPCDWKDYAICEYFGEGVIHCGRMLRRGRYKYIYVHEEQPQLFDLEEDPLELSNLAGKPGVADIERTMREFVLKDWNPSQMEKMVLQSQQERLFIKEAMAHGRPHPWDFQPVFDASGQYVRGKDAQETNRLMRYPRA